MIEAVTQKLRFSREWAMPSADTFTIPPVRQFVLHYLRAATVSIDPFARNTRLATYTNDLNPATAAQDHMDAVDWLGSLAARGVKADLGIFDPPYSPRQISECYQQVGREVGTEGTQNGKLYGDARNALAKVLADDAVVLSFGWNSAGMGKVRGFATTEILMVCHGGAHNDTICVAERRIAPEPELFGQQG